MKKIILLFSLLFSVTFNFAIDGMLILTNDPFYTERFEFTTENTPPTAMTINEVCKKENFYFNVSIVGFMNDKNNNSDVTMDIQVFKPNGEVYFETYNQPGIQKAQADTNMIYLAASVLRVSFEPEDSLGVYPIVIKLNDNISKQEKTISTQINLVENTYIPFNFDNDSYSQFFDNYYRYPHSRKAVDALIYYTQNILTNDDSRIIMLAFFKSIFNQHEYLIEHIYKIYPTLNKKSKDFILILLSCLDHDSSDFYKTLGKKDKKKFESCLNNKIKYFNADEEIIAPIQIDLFWAEFFATGSIEPVQKIINILDYAKYNGSIEKYKKFSQSDTDKKNALCENIFIVTRWSLSSNYHNNSLVNDYCNFIYNHFELNPNVKKELENIIKE